jgi:hypothetical protein
MAGVDLRGQSVMPDGRQIAVILLSAMGIILLVLGVTWKQWHSPQTLWSKEQAAEYTDAWRALKAAATSGIRAGDPNSDPKLAAAQARFDAIKAKLDHARTLNDHTGTALIVTAIGLIVGAGLLYRSNSKPADQ